MTISLKNIFLISIFIFLLYNLLYNNYDGFSISNKNICKDIYPEWFGSKDNTTILKNKTDILYPICIIIVAEK